MGRLPRLGLTLNRDWLRVPCANRRPGRGTTSPEELRAQLRALSTADVVTIAARYHPGDATTTREHRAALLATSTRMTEP